jgi:His/Glu/Gln/Arg/opine family amino acid ABC transporter permease subunit
MEGIFAQYAEYGSGWLSVLVPAARTTASLTITSFFLAMFIGGVVVAMRLSRFLPLQRLSRLYIEVVRATPVLAILFLIYFGLPGIGIVFNPFSAGVLGLGLSSAAYVAEILRVGLDALHRGQREAALAIGMGPTIMYRTIILPQVFRISLPALLVTLVSLLKDSSLCALITVNELTLSGRTLSTEYFLPLAIFLLTGAIYFFIAWPLSLVSRRLEQRLSRGRRAVA